MDANEKVRQDLADVEQQIEHLESAAGGNEEAMRQLHTLHEKVNTLRGQVTSGMSAWQRTELARHAQRPYTLDYVEHMFSDWSEVHGDRAYGDDPALLCGMARFRGEEVMVIGHQKGRDTKSRLYRNFGQANPEGYRKALRAMKMAEKFNRPVITLIDTPGAYPGLGAEERGQAEAIARNLREMARLRVPIITTVTGEGGSGGALAIAIADRVLMLENSVYSVISPEGCATIMWRDSTKRETAAQALKITPNDLMELKMIDEIIKEPAGGAHHDPQAIYQTLGDTLAKHLTNLRALSVDALIDARYEKFRRMGQFYIES